MGIKFKLKKKLIAAYQNMDVTIYEDDSKWSEEELAGYFLYNCSLNELKEEFSDIRNETVERKKAWKLIKKALFPYICFEMHDFHWEE